MAQVTVINLEDYLGGKDSRNRKKINKGKKGSVVERSGKLSVDFYYMGKRVREATGLDASEENKAKVRLFLDKIFIMMQEGAFKFAEQFPCSTKREFFTMIEGGNFYNSPDDVTFGDYCDEWMSVMEPSMSKNKLYDYTKHLNSYIRPYFEDIPFSKFDSIISIDYNITFVIKYYRRFLYIIMLSNIMMKSSYI